MTWRGSCAGLTLALALALALPLPLTLPLTLTLSLTTIWQFGPYDYTESTGNDPYNWTVKYSASMLQHYHEHKAADGMPERALVAYARTLEYKHQHFDGYDADKRSSDCKLSTLCEDEAVNLVSKLFRVWLDADTGDRRCAPRGAVCGLDAWAMLDASLPPHLRLYQGVQLSVAISARTGWDQAANLSEGLWFSSETFPERTPAFFGTPACVSAMMSALKFEHFDPEDGVCIHCQQDSWDGRRWRRWACDCPHVSRAVREYSATTPCFEVSERDGEHTIRKYFGRYPLLAKFENPRSFGRSFGHRINWAFDQSDTGAYLAIVAPGLHQSDADEEEAHTSREAYSPQQQALRMFMLAVDAPGVTAVPGGYAVVGKNLLGEERTFFAKADDSLQPKHPLATNFRERLVYVHHPQLGEEVAPHARLLDLTLTKGWTQHVAHPASAYEPRVTQTANGPVTIPLTEIQLELLTQVPETWPSVHGNPHFSGYGIDSLLELPIFDDGALRRRLLASKRCNLAQQLDALHEVLQVLTVVPGGAVYESRKRKYGDGPMASPSTEDAAAEGAEGGAEAQAEARAGDA